MEKAETDLMKFKPLKNDHMDFQLFYPIIKDTILGLCSIHQRNIVHLDIKPENIMNL